MERETREQSEMDVRGEAPEDGDTYSPSKLKMYDAQFFGFTPQTCVLRACNAFQDCLYDILPVVEKVCVRQLSKGESAEEEELLRAGARECSRKLQQFLEERFKQLFERMEPLLVDRCLSLPANVLLPEDQSHNKYPQDIQEVFKLESSIADLQTAYEAEICAKQALLAELEEQKEAQKQLEEILAWIRELQGAWVKEGNGSFHESFRLVMESVQKLQKNTREVCKKTPH
ncbi:protein MIS12 homolog [Sphaeramia orbicularis]|uniref:Protein MIS12 homolog n=1 Tax=Sphaeramia orbicularis TaxID=375764 RepID=A0A673CDP6_9TELE|nr:protein MIS12 homolog [Sphaeramia orbicularis]